MRIDGKQLAENILNKLRNDVEKLKASGTLPMLAVILIGDNPASISYINQKKKAAEAIGALLELSHLPKTTTHQDLAGLILSLNNDPSVHGIIIQRPIPNSSEAFSNVLATVSPDKDVDGFVLGSPFSVPVALAVERILENIWNGESTSKKGTFVSWLEQKKILVVGRGETAGRPIANHLKKLSLHPSVAHSKTANTNELLKESDIVIACVGKPSFIRPETIKRGSILISVGIMRDDGGKLRGDYDEEAVAGVASFYTPTPNGVGPVNVACLMKNLIIAAKKQS